jgi:hypothetical protein
VTLAVVGTGLDRVYPAQHAALAGRIAARGLVLSEYLLGTPPLPENFPRRNRILSALARGTLRTVGVPAFLLTNAAGGIGDDLSAGDLMAIRDPQNRARFKGEARRDLAGIFTVPFFTIENVAMVDAGHIIVANDNNLPFSIGRFVDRAADNEFILLRVPELLQAR